MRFGAYTELWAGLSSEITAKENGGYIIPWGRLQQSNPRKEKDIIAAMKRTKDGGPGMAESFWNWCEEQTKKYICLKLLEVACRFSAAVIG